VRGRIAESRAGAIIKRLTANTRVELFVIVVLAVGILSARSSIAEGQTSLLDSWVKQYVEEKAISLGGLKRANLADMSSAYVGYGGDSAAVANSPSPSRDPMTIRDSALMAISPTDENYIDSLGSERSGVSQYTVQEGDLLSFIASDFGVSAQSIMWANNIKDPDSLTPGQVLRIPPVSGVIYTVKKGDSSASLAKKFAADEGRIIAFNHLPQDGTLAIGDEIIIPDGHPAAAPIAVPSVGTIDNRIRRVGTYTAAGSALAAQKFGYLPDLGDYFRSPTTGYNWGILHDRNGIDVANSCGTGIYAAADGTVTTAIPSGWNGGFGKYIKISHPNGTETLYGHLSKIVVQVGQVVGKGEKIGLMGTTGRSTGCHLHFEVHGARNPLAKY
jgi:murein DD-endopeptidase MepM/ murein hydrolase activator NlpD